MAELRSSTTSYYEADGLGSITSLTNSAGAVANTYTYDSYGNLTASSGSVSNPLSYTGREFDSETGLYYYRSRYYDPGSGRFLTEDPLGFNAGDANFYAYVSNSPVGFVDPWGFDQKPSGLGPNPFPPLAGRDSKTFNAALKFAQSTACGNHNCDGALQSYGIQSLCALVSQMAANINVFDGRGSTYPAGKQNVSQFLVTQNAGAMVVMPVPITFLGDYFFNPTSINSLTQQRTLILLHEAVHQFGGKGDSDFGGSRNLSDLIAEKCFPAPKSLHLLGNVAY